ncbi:MAG: GTP cyclohydrolase MptA [Halobaculum sp.]
MSHQLPDVQATRPDVAVGLSQVGVTDVEKLVKIEREGERPWIFMAEFSVFVDLPSGRKGIDMSRNMEVIDEVLEAAVSGETSRVEDVCGDAADRLIAKHEYTSVAKVEMTADFVTRETTPASERPTQHTATVIASATATEEGTREEIGAEVTGMTVCPCSQGMSEARAREQLRELGVDDDTVEAFLDEVPQPGHSQRGHATLTIEDDGAPDVDLFDIIDIARDSMSARIYNYAKRPDEDHMTYSAHADAKFVEDCVRSLAEQTVDEFDHLDDDVVVRMKQSNDESIHQHNAHAEREVRLGRLREEMNGNHPAAHPDGEPMTNGR